MVHLKDGTEVEDTRLDRLRQFDEKSRNFGIMGVEAIAVKKPRSYTWGLAADKTLDQGQEGACVGFSCAQELIAKPSVAVGVDGNFARTKIYWPAQERDPWAGGSYPGASPRYEGTSILAGIQVMQQLGAMKEYRWSFTHDEMVLAVGYGGPGILGVDWHAGMMRPGKDGYIRPTGSLLGGHAILVRGVSLKEKFWLLHNTWGPDWGFGGTCKLSFDDMNTLRARQGEFVTPVKRLRVTV